MSDNTHANSSKAKVLTLEACIGNTPLVQLKHAPRVFAKLEGNNPAGSVKDRAAYGMISQAMALGQIKAGDTLIEATSGNTGIALAMVSALFGLDLILILPKNSTQERKDAVRAYGAHLIEVDSMEAGRDLAQAMQAAGEGVVLDQFNNPNNPLAHYQTTAPELWEQTGGQLTHFVSAMGTTGTIMGVGKFLKQKNSAIQIIGLQPAQGAAIAGIRRWEEAYLPKIFDKSLVDAIVDVHQQEAEDSMRALARHEGIFCGVSSGAAAFIAQKIAQSDPNAQVVFVVCDRGDRYLSSGVFS